MNIISHGFLIIVIIVLVFALVEIDGFNNQIKDRSRSQELQIRGLTKQLTKQIETCKSYNVFIEAVTKISKIPYTEEFDCYDHSKALQTELRELDIESSIMINGGRDHAWVAIWIESVTGNFIPIDHQYKILEVRDQNLVPVCTSNDSN